ncbi:hypothetical protein MLD38_039971 [Melastoma candidum]|uniref:Uncharacterized protein n=1 Tax=Melastoma candidum TaxID=119954 RepID=A0ACB9L3T1_9MYRT|nr:hypothetical protein MLD38_039971 [Melastoma candidum]
MLLLLEMVVFGLGEGHCFSPVVIGVDLSIACVDCVIALFAFCQLWRIHSRSQQLGWTRQKVFHFLTGCSNFGYCVYFILTLAATCNGWQFWSPYSFVLMALPEILFFTSFLLLLSFWIDLCHQANDEDEDEECSSRVSLLQSPLTKPGSSSSDGHGRCLPFHYFRVRSRQKIVVLAACLISALMVVVAILMGVGGGTAYSELIPKIYVSLLAVVVLALGAALAYYGFLICSRMRRVRSESASSEMWKVGGLSVVSPLCFTTSSVIALLPDSPILYHSQEQRNNSSAYLLVLLILYYYIGSSVPSAFLLWVMRELPQPISPALREERETIVFISGSSVSVHHPPPPQWTTSLSSQNQVVRASPI